MLGKCPNHIKENISNRGVMWLGNLLTSIHMHTPATPQTWHAHRCIYTSIRTKEESLKRLMQDAATTDVWSYRDTLQIYDERHGKLPHATPWQHGNVISSNQACAIECQHQPHVHSKVSCPDGLCRRKPSRKESHVRREHNQCFSSMPRLADASKQIRRVVALEL